MKFGRLVAGIAAAAVVLTSCSSGSGSGGGTSAAGSGSGSGSAAGSGTAAGGSDSGQGDSSAILKLALTQDVNTLLPMDYNMGDNSSVLDIVYDGLVHYDPKTKKPYNYVADSISNSGNKVWTINIKGGLKFQNGEAVDAAAFARAWNYAAYGPNAMANN
ncbi:MAG: hypothetical protein ACR2P2_16120, partial [Nakamurella sp.]